MAKKKARRNKDGSLDRRSLKAVIKKVRFGDMSKAERAIHDMVVRNVRGRSKAKRRETVPVRKKQDVVNNPSHYGGAENAYETIKIARAKLTPEEYVGAMKFQVLRYNDRSGKKDRAKTIEDYSKGLFYQQELVNAAKGLPVRGHLVQP